MLRQFVRYASCSTKMESVYVASVLNGLCDSLRKCGKNLEAKEIKVDGNGPVSEKDIEHICSNGDYLLADLPIIYQVMQRKSNLKWIHSTWAGSDYIMKRKDDSNKKLYTDIIVTKTDTYGPIIAEYVIGYILADMRRLFEMKENQRSRTWKRDHHFENKSMIDSTVGILGLGSCGKEVARICHSFGMEVWAMGRRPSAEREEDPNVNHYRMQNEDSLKEILSNCDYVCSVLPSTKETRGLLAGNMLAHCKPKKPVFINVGRGDVTDEESVMKALNEGWISTAVLDVFNEEPLSPDSPLWSMPNCHITPHIAALGTKSIVTASFLKNYDRIRNGQDVIGRIDFNKEY